MKEITYGVKTERDGWHRVTRNGRILRGFLPFAVPGDPRGYNLFVLLPDAAAAAKKMNQSEVPMSRVKSERTFYPVRAARFNKEAQRDIGRAVLRRLDGCRADDAVDGADFLADVFAAIQEAYAHQTISLLP